MALPLAVAEHLDLDVARLVEIFFEIDGIVAESGLGFAARAGERMREIFGRTRDLHAAPAAAGRRLDEHRIADLLGDRQRFRRR